MPAYILKTKDACDQRSIAAYQQVEQKCSIHADQGTLLFVFRVECALPTNSKFYLLNSKSPRRPVSTGLFAQNSPERLSSPAFWSVAEHYQVM